MKKNERKFNSKTVPPEVHAKAVNEAKEFLKKPPTLPEVRQWLAHDIDTAIYSLSCIKHFPELLDKMAHEMFEHANKSPQTVMDERSKEGKLQKTKVPVVDKTNEEQE